MYVSPKGKIVLRMGDEAVSLGQCFLMSQWNVVPSLSGVECSWRHYTPSKCEKH